jgi:hypothetical protein
MGTVLLLVSVHYLRVLESRSSSVRIVHMYSRVDARDSLFLHHTQALYIHHSIVPDISKGRHMHLNLALLCNECAIWSSEFGDMHVLLLYACQRPCTLPRNLWYSILHGHIVCILLDIQLQHATDTSQVHVCALADHKGASIQCPARY